MKAVIVEDEAIASRRLANLIGELAPEMEIRVSATRFIAHIPRTYVKHF